MNLHARQSSLAVARHLVNANLKYFIAACALVFLLVTAIISGISMFGTPTTSIMDFTTLQPRYWLLALGVVLTTLIVRVYVAHGVTRRHFGGGTVIAAVLVSLLTATLLAAAHLAEYLVYRANGWTVELTGSHLFTTGDQFGLITIEFALVFIGHFFAGWTIGGLFARLPVLSAVLLILPAYLPAVLIETTLGVNWPGLLLVEQLAWDGIRLPAALGVSLVILAGQAVLNQRLLRGLAIKPKPI